jgi:hypothetical protein
MRSESTCTEPWPRLEGVRAAVAILVLVAMFGCGAAILKPEYPFLGPDLAASPKSAANSKVLIYNNSNSLFEATAQPMEVRIDGKAVASLRIGEYVQLELPPGQYTLNLTHWDMAPFRRDHPLSVRGPFVSVAVFSTVARNEIAVSEGPPSERFRPKSFRPYRGDGAN